MHKIQKIHTKMKYVLLICFSTLVDFLKQHLHCPNYLGDAAALQIPLRPNRSPTCAICSTGPRAGPWRQKLSEDSQSVHADIPQTFREAAD